MSENKFKKISVRVKTLEHFKGDLPKYETLHASGMDVRAQLQEQRIVKPRERVIVPTGLQVEIPEGYEIQVRPRSGWAFKKGITVLNSPGTVDADYRGEISIILVHLGEEDVLIQDQDRIAQLVLCPVVQVEWSSANDLSETKRGAGGFGSTGIG